MKFRKKFFKKEQSTFKLLNQRLEVRRKELLNQFEEKNKDTTKWLRDKGIDLEDFLGKTTKGALVSMAAGIVLFSSGLPADTTAANNDYSAPDLEAVKLVSELQGKASTSVALSQALQKELPKNTRILNSVTESQIANTISQITGVKVTPQLDGNSLNTSYGRIGLEQHLPRYPGETMQAHLDNDPAESRYGRSGMTFNRGAFGYFAANKNSLTQQAIDQEKYYVVVQTFDIPGYKNNVNWYKNRKVVVVNPENGRAIVGDIADSGPAKWTGKSFGGSPELMDFLGMYPGETKAPVLMFFVDETTGSVSLGPI